MGIASFRHIKESYLNHNILNAQMHGPRARSEHKKAFDGKQRDALYQRVIDLAYLASSITEKQSLAQDNYSIQGFDQKENVISDLSKKYKVQEYSIKIIFSQAARRQLDDIVRIFQIDPKEISVTRDGKRQFTEKAAKIIFCETISIYQDLLMIKTNPVVRRQYLEYLLFGKITGIQRSVDFFHGPSTPFHSKIFPELLHVSGIHRNHHADSTLFKITSVFSAIFKKNKYRFAFTDTSQKILSNFFFPSQEDEFKNELESVLLEGYFKKDISHPIETVEDFFTTKREELFFLNDMSDENREEEKYNLILNFRDYLKDKENKNAFFDYESRNKVSKSFLVRNRIESENFSKHQLAGLFEKPKVLNSNHFFSSVQKLRKIVLDESRKLRKENELMDDFIVEVFAASSFESLIEKHLEKQKENAYTAKTIADSICKENKNFNDQQALFSNIASLYLKKRENRKKITEVIFEKEKCIENYLEIFKKIENMCESEQILKNKEKCIEHLSDLKKMREKIAKDFGDSTDEIMKKLNQYEEEIDIIFSNIEIFLQMKMDQLNPNFHFEEFFNDHLVNLKLHDSNSVDLISKNYEKAMIEFNKVVSNIAVKVKNSDNIELILSDLSRIELDLGTDFGRILKIFCENLENYFRQRFYLSKSREYLSLYFSLHKDYHKEYTKIFLNVIQSELDLNHDMDGFLFSRQYHEYFEQNQLKCVFGLIEAWKKKDGFFHDFLKKHDLLEKKEGLEAIFKRYLLSRQNLSRYKKYLANEIKLSADEKIYLELFVSNISNADDHIVRHDMMIISDFIGQLLTIPELKKFVSEKISEISHVIEEIRGSKHVFSLNQDRIQEMLNKKTHFNFDLASEASEFNLDISRYRDAFLEIESLKTQINQMQMIFSCENEKDDINESDLFFFYMDCVSKGKNPDLEFSRDILNPLKKNRNESYFLLNIKSFSEKFEKALECFFKESLDLENKVKIKKLQEEYKPQFSFYWDLISKSKELLEENKRIENKLHKLGIDPDIESFSEIVKLTEAIKYAHYVKKLEISLYKSEDEFDSLFVDLDGLVYEIEKIKKLESDFNRINKKNKSKIAEEVNRKISQFSKSASFLKDSKFKNIDQAVNSIKQMSNFIKYVQSIEDTFCFISKKNLDSLSQKELDQIEDFLCDFVFFDLILTSSKKKSYGKISIQNIIIDQRNPLYENLKDKIDLYNSWICAISEFREIKDVIQECIENCEIFLIEVDNFDDIQSQKSASSKFFSFFLKWMDSDFDDFTHDYRKEFIQKKEEAEEQAKFVSDVEDAFFESIKNCMHRYPSYVKSLLLKSVSVTSENYPHLLSFSEKISTLLQKNQIFSDSTDFDAAQGQLDFNEMILEFQSNSVVLTDHMEFDFTSQSRPTDEDLVPVEEQVFERPVHLKLKNEVPKDKKYLSHGLEDFLAQFNLLEKLLSTGERSLFDSRHFLSFFQETMGHFEHVLFLLTGERAAQGMLQKVYYGYDYFGSYVAHFENLILKFKSIDQEKKAHYPAFAKLQESIQRYEEKKTKPLFETYTDIVSLLICDNSSDLNDFEKEILVRFYNIVLEKYEKINPGSGIPVIKKYDESDFKKHLSTLLFSVSSDEFLIQLYLDGVASDLNSLESFEGSRLKLDQFLFKIIHRLNVAGLDVALLKPMIEEYKIFADEHLSIDHHDQISRQMLAQLVNHIKKHIGIDVIYFFGPEFRKIFSFGQKFKMCEYFLGDSFQNHLGCGLIQGHQKENSKPNIEVVDTLVQDLQKFILQVSSKDKFSVFQLFEIFEKCFFHDRSEIISKWDLMHTFFPFEMHDWKTLNPIDIIKTILANIILYTIIRFDLDLNYFLFKFQSKLDEMAFDYSNRFHVGKFNRAEQKQKDRFDIQLWQDFGSMCTELIQFLIHQKTKYHDIFLDQELASFFVAKTPYEFLTLLHLSFSKQKNLLKYPFLRIKDFLFMQTDNAQQSQNGMIAAKHIASVVNGTRGLLNYRVTHLDSVDHKKGRDVVSHFRRSETLQA